MNMFPLQLFCVMMNYQNHYHHLQFTCTGSPLVEYAIDRVPTIPPAVANVITVLPLPFAKSIDAAIETSSPPSRPIKFCGSSKRFDHAVVSSSV